MKYEIYRSKKFKRRLKKLPKAEILLVLDIIEKLANDEVLEPRHKDHALSGEFSDFRECHIKSDLLLIYQKNINTITLVCVDVGSHSNLFN